MLSCHTQTVLEAYKQMLAGVAKLTAQTQNTVARSAQAPSPGAAAAAEEYRDVIVLTGDQETPDIMEKAKQALNDVGAEIKRNLRCAPGFVARIPASATKTLSEAGLEVVDDDLMKHFQAGKDPAKFNSNGFMRASEGNALGPTESLSYQGSYHGKGVGIAVLDSGVANHPDLQGRIVAFADAVQGSRRPIDEFGHGTHVAGDAAGDGTLSGGKFKGPASEANIIGIRVLGGEEGERLSDAVDCLVDGLQWMVQNKERYNIRVANLSLGLPLIPVREDYYGRPTHVMDPIKKAIDKAVDAGITVVVAAGNSGEEGAGSIAETPAINPNVITVGALDNHGTVDSRDDEVADFSSRGPTPFGEIKPDVIAPGVNVMSLNAPDSDLERMNVEQQHMKEAIGRMSDREVQRMAMKMVRVGLASPAILRIPPDELRQRLYESMHPHKMAGQLAGGPAYMAMDGTSMASPIVAGVAATMIEANPSLSPQQVKDILMQTAKPLPRTSQYAQGAGVVDADAAVKMAEQLKKYPSQRVQAPAPRPAPVRPVEERRPRDLFEALFGIAS
jgi:serine protease AprX